MEKKTRLTSAFVIGTSGYERKIPMMESRITANATYTGANRCRAVHGQEERQEVERPDHEAEWGHDIEDEDDRDEECYNGPEPGIVPLSREVNEGGVVFLRRFSC